MARTWKDRPYKLLLLEEMKKDNVRHNHTPHNAYKQWVFQQGLSLRFFKFDSQAINEHRAYLDSLGVNYRYHMAEEAGYCTDTYRYENGRPTAYKTVEMTPKRVNFVIEYLWVNPVLSSEEITCSHWKNYDWQHGLDRTTGKRPTCSPRTPEKAFRRRRGPVRTELARSTVRQSLELSRSYANAGGLDVDYSDQRYEERFGPKVWIY